MNILAIGVRLIIVLLLVRSPIAAADLLDTVSQNGKELITRWLPSSADNPPKSLPSDLPAQWRGGYIYDNVFDCSVFIATMGVPTKPTLLLVHGLGQNGAKDWLNVIPSLTADYHILVLDLPGFGYSDTPAKKYSPTAYAELLHRLKQQLKLAAPIIVVGHSMGAAVALRYADLFPADIAQLVLVDAAGILQRTAFVKHSADGQVDIDIDALPNGLIGYAANLQDLGGALIEKLLKIPDPTTLLTHSDKAWGLMLVKTPNLNAALALAEENFSHAVLNTKIKTSIIWGRKTRSRRCAQAKYWPMH